MTPAYSRVYIYSDVILTETRTSQSTQNGFQSKSCTNWQGLLFTIVIDSDHLVTFCSTRQPTYGYDVNATGSSLNNYQASGRIGGGVPVMSGTDSKWTVGVGAAVSGTHSVNNVSYIRISVRKVFIFKFSVSGTIVYIRTQL